MAKAKQDYIPIETMRFFLLEIKELEKKLKKQTSVDSKTIAPGSQEDAYIKQLKNHTTIYRKIVTEEVKKNLGFFGLDENKNFIKNLKLHDLKGMLNATVATKDIYLFMCLEHCARMALPKPVLEIWSMMLQKTEVKQSMLEAINSYKEQEGSGKQTFNILRDRVIELTCDNNQLQEEKENNTNSVQETQEEGVIGNNYMDTMPNEANMMGNHMNIDI